MSPLDFDPRNDGYWGDTTATLDWCEQNYEVIYLRGCHSLISFCKLFAIPIRMNLVLSPEAITGRNLKFRIGELVHRRVLEHRDQPVHDHSPTLGNVQMPPGDSFFEGGVNVTHRRHFREALKLGTW